MNGSVTHILAQVTLMFMNTNRMYIRGEKNRVYFASIFPWSRQGFPEYWGPRRVENIRVMLLQSSVARFTIFGHNLHRRFVFHSC